MGGEGGREGGGRGREGEGETEGRGGGGRRGEGGVGVEICKHNCCSAVRVVSTTL